MRASIVVRTFVGLSILASGCKWISTRSDFERDPFVMSHLTHAKGDPMFAGTENASVLDGERSQLQAASVSRKPSYAAAVAVRQMDQSVRYGSAPAQGRAADYTWLKGQIQRRSGRNPGWYLRYANSFDQDRYGGEIRLADHPRLGIVRDGDYLLVEGQVSSPGEGDVHYLVQSLSLLDP